MPWRAVTFTTIDVTVDGTPQMPPAWTLFRTFERSAGPSPGRRVSSSVQGVTATGPGSGGRGVVR